MKIKTQKGITLVALVITIIVLLILAAVAIGAIQNKGIIKYAQNASADYEAAEKQEQSVLASLLDKIKEKAPGNSGEGNEENEGTGNEDNVTIAEIDVSNYGDFVEYSKDLNNDGNLSNDWKIFYNEGDYVYIIAADYLPYSLIPNSTTDTTKLNMSNKGIDYPYSAYWESSDNFRSTGSETITDAVANKYKLSWLDLNVDANGVRTNNSNDNAKSTGDLLNVNVWTSVFGDFSKGIEAIGAPTLEMWVASWNEKGKKEGIAKYVKLYTTSNITGYYVGNQENPTSVSYNVGTETYGYNDTLYFPHQSSYGNCYGYWLASPAKGFSGNDGVILVYNGGGGMDGGIIAWSYPMANAYEYYYAARPLVSLPSELLVKNADGSLSVASE